jgi:hypothetical protein
VKPGRGLAGRGEGQPKTMSSPFLIACAAVAVMIALLIAASVFGVSRRALEAEMRLTDEDAGESSGDRDEAGIAA